MKKYKIVSHRDTNELENEVNNLINEGWKIAGGVSVAYKHEHSDHKHIPGHLEYVQALEKE